MSYLIIANLSIPKPNANAGTSIPKGAKTSGLNIPHPPNSIQDSLSSRYTSHSVDK